MSWWTSGARLSWLIWGVNGLFIALLLTYRWNRDYAETPHAPPPQIEIVQFDFVAMDQEKTHSIATINSAYRYADGSLKALDLSWHHHKADGIEQIDTPVIEFTSGRFYFEEGIKYRDGTNLEFASEKGSYNPNTKQFSGEGRFILADDKGILTGESLLIDNRDHITGKQITLTYEAP